MSDQACFVAMFVASCGVCEVCVYSILTATLKQHVAVHTDCRIASTHRHVQ